MENGKKKKKGENGKKEKRKRMMRMERGMLERKEKYREEKSISDA